MYTTYVLLFPSETKLQVSYGFTALTLVSGTLLVISMPAHLVSACYSGLAYLALTFMGIMGTRYRLAHERVRIDRRR